MIDALVQTDDTTTSTLLLRLLAVILLLLRLSIRRPVDLLRRLLLALGGIGLLLLLRLGLLLLLSVLDLVLDQVVERRNGTDQAADVNRHQLVVGLDTHRLGQLAILDLRLRCGPAKPRRRRRRGQVREQVEHVLEVTQNGMVDGELAVQDFLEVLADIT